MQDMMQPLLMKAMRRIHVRAKKAARVKSPVKERNLAKAKSLARLPRLNKSFG